GELELVGERGGRGQALAGVRLGRLAFAEELGQGVELLADLVQLRRRVELALVGPALAQRLLGFLGTGPEIRRGRLLPQTVERAPRGVEIKDSRGATEAAPRRFSARR